MLLQLFDHLARVMCGLRDRLSLRGTAAEIFYKPLDYETDY